MPAPISSDGVFDDAIFNPRDYRSIEEIVNFVHQESRLGLVRKKKEHFVAEFLVKRRLSWSSMLGWEEGRDPVICGSADEAMRFVREFIPNEERA